MHHSHTPYTSVYTPYTPSAINMTPGDTDDTTQNRIEASKAAFQGKLRSLEPVVDRQGAICSQKWVIEMDGLCDLFTERLTLAGIAGANDRMTPRRKPLKSSQSQNVGVAATPPTCPQSQRKKDGRKGHGGPKGNNHKGAKESTRRGNQTTSNMVGDDTLHLQGGYHSNRKIYSGSALAPPSSSAKHFQDKHLARAKELKLVKKLGETKIGRSHSPSYCASALESVLGSGGFFGEDVGIPLSGVEIAAKDTARREAVVDMDTTSPLTPTDVCAQALLTLREETTLREGKEHKTSLMRAPRSRNVSSSERLCDDEQNLVFTFAAGRKKKLDDEEEEIQLFHTGRQSSKKSQYSKYKSPNQKARVYSRYTEDDGDIVQFQTCLASGKKTCPMVSSGKKTNSKNVGQSSHRKSGSTDNCGGRDSSSVRRRLFRTDSEDSNQASFVFPQGSLLSFVNSQTGNSNSTQASLGEEGGNSISSSSRPSSTNKGSGSRPSSSSSSYRGGHDCTIVSVCSCTTTGLYHSVPALVPTMEYTATSSSDDGVYPPVSASDDYEYTFAE